MSVNIIQATTETEKKAFIDIEWTINKGLKNWISPLRLSRKEILNTKKNPFFKHAEIAFFLAYKNDEPAGRIAAITNQNFNDFHEDNSGFWGFFECINDQDVANQLFRATTDWLKSKNKD